MLKVKSIDKNWITKYRQLKGKENDYFQVLIIDDDPSIPLLIRHILQNDEKLIIHTYNSETDVVKSFCDVKFDLCIIDVNLEYTNGFALGKLLRSMSSKEFPIIYISKNRENLEFFYQNGQPNTYFYTKPIRREEFIEVFNIMAS